MTDQESYVQSWEQALLRLLHPTQVLILEALTYLDYPVSPTTLERISDGQIKLNSWDYHCKRLVVLGFLEEKGSAQRRGATERFYGLRFTGRA